MATREVRVEYAKTLMEEPETGHNRWHPDIPPVVTCDPGDEVVLQTRDAFDGQMGPQATLETVAGPNLNVVHPLTGPVYVNGAEPGGSRAAGPPPRTCRGCASPGRRSWAPSAWPPTGP
jgi:formamidase